MLTKVSFINRGVVVVLEGFLFHDMAPVAGGITYGQKNGFVFFSRLVKRLFSPGIPIHRIMGVLEKIWAFFQGQPVGMIMRFRDSTSVFIGGFHCNTIFS